MKLAKPKKAYKTHAELIRTVCSLTTTLLTLATFLVVTVKLI